MPRVSVLLPVYNAADYVATSIHSVLNQSFRDLELIVIDDGSTDGSAEVIRRSIGSDPRVRFLSRENIGFARTLNQMLEIASGELIARLDADDEALPERIATQVKFMDAHADCVVVGGGAIHIDAEGDPLSIELYPQRHEEIEQRILSGGGGIIHPSVMIRAETIRLCGGYSLDCPVVEDQDLWLRMALRGRLANLAIPLIRYRVHAGNMTFTGAEVAGRRLAEVLCRAHRERGLEPPTTADWAGVPLVDDWDRRRQWAWSAIASGYFSTARKHAKRLVRERLFVKDAWVLLFYAFLPKTAEWLRRVYRIGR